MSRVAAEKSKARQPTGRAALIPGVSGCPPRLFDPASERMWMPHRGGEARGIRDLARQLQVLSECEGPDRGGAG